VLTVSGLKRDTARQGAAYNLSIQGIHTYHVGDNEILVHNMCPPEEEQLSRPVDEDH
jgi:hypothetical protein